MSPTTEALKLPPHILLQPKERHPLSRDEAMVVRDRQGRVLAAIEALRPDCLPN